MSGILAAGIANWPIFHQLAWLFGKVLNWIYDELDAVFHIQNIGLCIIILTVIVFTLMIPFTIKQQKWSKMSSVMQPELRKIQKKYAGKKDQVSMVKQQEEMQAVYDKYGTSILGGCLPALIPMPLIFSLYPVIQDIPNYITHVKDLYMRVVTQIMATEGFQTIIEDIGSAKPIAMSPRTFDYSKADTLVSVLYRFQDSTWKQLMEKMPGLTDIIQQTMESVGDLNLFCGINLANVPMNMLSASIKNFSFMGIILAVSIPILAGVTQFLSGKLMPQPETASQDSVTNSMKTMNYVMPLFSVFLGFTLPAGLGLFWAASAAVRSVQQFFINRHMDKIPVADIIEANRKKAAKKREKKGISASEINRMARTNTRNFDARKSAMSQAEREELLRNSRQKAKNARPGSLADRANMVSRFNEGQSFEDIRQKGKE